MTTLRSRAHVSHPQIAQLLAAILEHVEEFAPVERDGAEALISGPFGEVRIRPRSAQAMTVELESSDGEMLSLIQNFLTEHVEELGGGEASVEWEALELPASGVRAPRVHELAVVGAESLGPHLRRLHFAAPDLAAMAGAGDYHIRLMLPPRGRIPVWPVPGTAGRLVWPEGADALATRIYTIRSADAASGTISVDFVLHGGDSSPGARFGAEAGPGDLAACLEPGGGGLPEGENLLLLGDETALPAILRILEELPAGRAAEVYVEIGGAEDELAEVGRLNWLHRGTAPAGSRLEAVLAQKLAAPGAEALTVWAGAEQAAARRMRLSCRARPPAGEGTGRGRDLVVAYWDSTGAGD